MAEALSKRALFILAVVLPLFPLAKPAAADPFEDEARKPGAVVIKNTLCKISVGRTLPSGSDEVFTFDCATVLTRRERGLNVLVGTARAPGWPGVFYSNAGFPCIINRRPAGGDFVCTTKSRTAVLRNGRASLICFCANDDPSCRPVEAGKEPCAP